MGCRNIKNVAIDAKTLGGIELSRFLYGDNRGSSTFNGSADDIKKSGFYRLNGDGRINMLIHWQHPSDDFAFQIGKLYYNNHLLFRMQAGGVWSKFETIIEKDMQLTDLQTNMGGGVTEFHVGPYAVTIQQKGGQRNGVPEYKQHHLHCQDDGCGKRFKRSHSKDMDTSGSVLHDIRRYNQFSMARVARNLSSDCKTLRRSGTSSLSLCQYSESYEKESGQWNVDRLDGGLINFGKGVVA